MSKPSLGGLIPKNRRRVKLDTQSLVRHRPMFEEGTLPLLVEPTAPGVSLVGWANANRKLLDQWLAQYGGILFRGFAIDSEQAFKDVIHATGGNPLAYRERSSPRHAVAERIYTSTDYPAPYKIFLHNENSYQGAWPMKLFFYCHTAPAERGETPIADCRRIYKRIPRNILRKFEEKGIMYQRNFGTRYGLPWQSVFQTSNKEEVEAHCVKAGLGWEWKSDGGLRTLAVRPLVDRHPQTGDPVWFNHAVFFHVSTLEPEIRNALHADMEDKDLPNHSYYGDGTPIEDEVAAQLREIILAEEVSFSWQQHDVLLLDNMLSAHGRSPYQGDRKILVAMSHPMTLSEAKPVMQAM